MNNTKSSKPLHPAEFAEATEAWLSVVRAYNHCTAAISAQIAPLGINLLQHEVLINLLRTPGITQQQLAVRCFSAKSGISMLIARFETDGVIRRQPDPNDKRAYLLELTKAGTMLANETLQVQLKVIKEMAGVFEPEEMAVLKHRMDQMSDILIAMETKEG